MENTIGQNYDWALWDNESLEYFKRNYTGKDIYKINPHPCLKSAIEKSNINIMNGKCLEIGCSAGRNLICLKKKFNIKAYGTEPSDKLVVLLNKKIPDCSFHCCYSHQLPFKKNSFDLVMLLSVLHWVDRNYILHSIGEAIRVSKKYLIVSDFAPVHPYSVKYKHKKPLRTFKVDYQYMIESSLLMKMIFCEYTYFGDPWKVVKTGIYQKTDIQEVYPEKEDLSLLKRVKSRKEL